VTGYIGCRVDVMLATPPPASPIEEARRLREEAAAIRDGLGAVVARLREQRAALRRVAEATQRLAAELEKAREPSAGDGQPGQGTAV
jgi:hypothetical protein